MEPEFWNSRWNEGRIGFHRDAPNPHLVRYGPSLSGWPGRGFLPLCGKSVDLPWLARQGVDAIGNELVALAVKQFVEEQAAETDVRTVDGFEVHTVQVEGAEPEVQMWQGDFFDLTLDHVGKLDWIFDRAALIALPPERRGEYVKHLRRLAGSARQILLVTLEYPSGMSGPPFSVTEVEVRFLYSGLKVERIEHIDVLPNYPMFVQNGVKSLWESVWRVHLDG